MSDFALEIENLTRTFGVRKALDGVSFNLKRGAFLSVFGPNGAGKTTLLRVLSTLAAPSRDSSVKVLGYDVVEDAVELREHIGVISHNPLLYPDLTADENLQFFADLYCLENPKERIDELLEAVELTHRRLDVVRGFSRGMVQRLALARTLLPSPELIFLDEPYSGLDPHASDILDSLIAGIREEHTFVMVSHDLEKGLSLCSDALILARGKVVLFEAAENIERDEFSRIFREAVGRGVS
ncbi:MAG: ABC transporter ATP-binding protein [Coriobacteriia bacterium]|nr:ABC transporter ATP-binding protein [Coriobacteriia bacterium]